MISSSSGSNEFVFLLPDDENRTRRSADDTFGGAADAQMPPARVAVRCDDDKIDIQIFRRLGDLVGRVASE